MVFDGLAFLIDMLIELRDLLIIDGLELLEEGLLEGWVGQALIMVDEMSLVELLKSVEDISLHRYNLY